MQVRCWSLSQATNITSSVTRPTQLSISGSIWAPSHTKTSALARECLAHVPTRRRVMNDLGQQYWQADPASGLAVQWARLAQAFPRDFQASTFGESCRGRPLLAGRVGHGD